MVESAVSLQSGEPVRTDKTSPGPVVVRIELLRVQTFLFAVPKLRHMVGANVLLGEVMRLELPALAIRCGASANAVPDDWLDMFPQPSETDNPDPLAKVWRSNDRDEPRALAGRGILVRDGGHFAALFRDGEPALRFQELAEALLQRELPGLMFEVSCVDLVAPLDPKAKRKESRQPRLAQPRVLVDLPVFEVCRYTGRHPAAARVPVSRSDTTAKETSRLALRLKRRGDAFFGQDRSRRSKDPTRDIIGLLRDQLHHEIHDKVFIPPVDLEDLCGPDASGRRDYLAVIHADGNRVGLRYAHYCDRYRQCAAAGAGGDGNAVAASDRGNDWLRREGFGETFYYSMRVAVRRAVVDALSETFSEFKGKYRPFQLLMLGGDDLLLLCRARFALPFLVAYAQGLQCSGLADAPGDGKSPLSIGAGVVIARPSVPFHRLHALAEDLAGSAKRLDRALSKAGPGVSVVDWMVFSESWADEITAIRRREAQVRYRLANGNEEWLALTGRPYRILRPDDGSADSLEALLDDAAHLPGAARSQLRQIALDLYQGRRWAELRWHELPADTRAAFQRAGVKAPWRPLGTQDLGDRTANGFLTRVADLVELNEFARLGRRDATPQPAAAASEEEVSHG
jgi:hypothetical protein